MKEEIYLVIDFIDYLNNTNDLFYNIGDSQYKFDKQTGIITFDLSVYGKQSDRFVREVKNIIDSDVDLSNNHMSGDITFIGVENNQLKLTVR